MTRLHLAPLFLLLIRCSVAPTTPAPVPESSDPPERILVEKTVEETGLDAGAASLTPQARVLVLRTSKTAPPSLRVLVTKEAPVGEIVEAEIRIEGDPKRRYRVVVAPSDDRVRIESPPERIVPGGAAFSIRFTRTSPGCGAIRVQAEPARE